MTGLQTLAARLILAAVAGIAGVVLSSLPAVQQTGYLAFRRLCLLAFLLSRFGMFTLVFLVLHIAPRGDIPAYYFPEAASVVRGLLPYRDFGSSYAPLHAFLDGGVLLLWHSPLAIILFAICVESLLFFLWLRIGPDFFPERDVRIAAVLYLSSALSVQFVLLDGQDNVIVALLVLLAVWAAMRLRPLRSGALLGLGVVAVKLIPVFFAPVFFVGVKRRWSWSAGFLGTLALGYGTFAALRLPILQPLTIEGPLKSSGTVPFVIELATGRPLPVTVWDLIMVLVLAAVYAAVALRTSSGASPGSAVTVLWGVTAAVMVMLLFANKSWSPYLLLCLFPLCVAVAGRGLGARILLALFGVVALAEKSYWATLLNLNGALDVRAAVLRHEPIYVGFLPIQLLLLLGYGWLLWLCLDRLRRSGETLAHRAGTLQEPTLRAGRSTPFSDVSPVDSGDSTR